MRKFKLNEVLTRQLLRFLVSGSCAVLVDYGTYLLFQRLGLEISLAKVLSYICGAIVGFVINKLWTFERGESAQTVTEILKYALVYGISALLNAAVNQLVLGITGIAILGFLCATGVSMVFNFLGMRLFVFKK